MERELAALQMQTSAVEDSYGPDVLHPTIIKGHLAKRLADASVIRWLARRRPGYLNEFQKVVNTVAFAARLPAALFQEHDKLRKPCVRLVASSEAVTADWEGISDQFTETGKVSKSRNLGYVALLDGYHVKVTMDGDTTTIPSKQVRRITSCKERGGNDEAISANGEPPR